MNMNTNLCLKTLILSSAFAFTYSASAAVMLWAPSSGDISNLNAGNLVSSVDTGVASLSGPGNVTVDVQVTPFGGGAINLSTSSVAGNQINPARPNDSLNTGNTWTFTFSEPVAFSVTSQAHSFFGDNEIIQVSSSTPLNAVLTSAQPDMSLMDGSLQTATLSGETLTGSTPSTSVVFEGNSFDLPGVSAGTFWTVDSGATAITSISVAYRREGEPDPDFAGGTEPYVIDIVPTAVPEMASTSIAISLLALFAISKRRRK